MPTTVRVDGLPVAPGTAAAFYRLKAAFEAQFPGITLHIYSGYRDYEDQKALFLKRYREQSWGTGPYGDVRWWQGRRYVRISGEGTVAQPGSSNHGDGRAIDIRDSAPTPGVTQYNNQRSLWIRQNAHRFDFYPDGYINFNEPWHLKVLIADPWTGVGSPTGEVSKPADTTPSKTPEQPVEVEEDEDDMPKNSGFFYKTTSNGKETIKYLVVNTGSGFYHEFSNGAGNGPMNRTYVDPVAASFEAPTFAEITAAHAAEIKKGLDRVTGSK